jgi:hypothetical protein
MINVAQFELNSKINFHVEKLLVIINLSLEPAFTDLRKIYNESMNDIKITEIDI